MDRRPKETILRIFRNCYHQATSLSPFHNSTDSGEYSILAAVATAPACLGEEK
jgi:hypothetical protein